MLHHTSERRIVILFKCAADVLDLLKSYDSFNNQLHFVLWRCQVIMNIDESMVLGKREDQVHHRRLLHATLTVHLHVYDLLLQLRKMLLELNYLINSSFLLACEN